MKARSIVAACAAFTLALGAAADGRAQDSYPNKPVKLLIGFPPGGLLDTVSRIVGERMAALLGQPFIVDARPGAGGLIATSALAKSAPDGYTLMMINDNHALNPYILKEVPYDSVKDFAPIGFVGSTPLVFCAYPGLGLKSIKDLVEMAKAKNGGLTYGSVGPRQPAAPQHRALRAGRRRQHDPRALQGRRTRPRRSGRRAHQRHDDLTRGQQGAHRGRQAHAARGCVEPTPRAPSQRAHHRGGRVPARRCVLVRPDGPAGTPPAVIGKLEKALAETVAQAEVRKRLADMGTLVTPMNAKEFGAFIQSEMAKWRDAVKSANVKIE